MSHDKKYKKNKKIESENSDEAMAIARGIKQENQTKAQTKLIAQGIRKGIELYKYQQNKKNREIDKRKKKELKNKSLELDSRNSNKNQPFQNKYKRSLWLPWTLLVLSWLYYFMSIFKLL
jgi:hypothetical protein